MSNTIIRKKSDGFTLIELLIIIVIIGGIMTIAFPNLIGLTDSSKNEVINANIRTLLTEIEVYNSENNGYPELDTYDFIDNPEGWNSLEKIVDDIGDDENLYNYEQADGDFVFSVKLAEGEFIGISKSDGLQTDLNEHPEL